MENKRRKLHEQLEVVQEGFANGVAPGIPFNDEQKLAMIDEAEEAYGKFLTALNVIGEMTQIQQKHQDV